MTPIKPMPKKPYQPEYDWINPTGRPVKYEAPSGVAPARTAPRASRLTGPPRCWRVARVAAHLDVSRKRVYQLVGEGQLEAVRVGPRMMRILLPSLERYIEGRRRAEAEREP
jgi:excisionase family DNA binding protein